jgi:hypothetical protein
VASGLGRKEVAAADFRVKAEGRMIVVKAAALRG